MIAAGHSDFYLFETVGSAYSALNQIGAPPELSCEMIPYESGRTLLILSYQKMGLVTLTEGLFLKHSRTLNVPAVIIDAYLGRLKNNLVDDLFVFESDFLGEAVEVASQWTSLDISILDLRMNRASGRTTLFASAPKFKDFHYSGQGRFERISQPNTLVKKFF